MQLNNNIRWISLVKPHHEEAEDHVVVDSPTEAVEYCKRNMDQLRSPNDFWAILKVAAVIDSNGNHVIQEVE